MIFDVQVVDADNRDFVLASRQMSSHYTQQYTHNSEQAREWLAEDGAEAMWFNCGRPDKMIIRVRDVNDAADNGPWSVFEVIVRTEVSFSAEAIP